ncbi:MAG: allantoicase [Betaproteobacteria bacterium]
MAIPIVDPNAPSFTKKNINLADARLGAKAISCSDEFFAPLERMLNPEPAVFIPGKYDTNGKWMDGWETRRKRIQGQDWAIIQLARPGLIRGFDIDTSHFTGNYAPAITIQGCFDNADPTEHSNWFDIVIPTNLQGNQHHYVEVPETARVSHLKITIFPDGGIARLRVFGQPDIDWKSLSPKQLIDFAAVENGAYVIATNNEHFGLANNLLLPGRGVNMGDGWETRRRREPGYDWCVIKLAHAANLEKIEVDTCHFKGNYPDQCSFQAQSVTGGTDQSVITESMFWPILMPQQKLSMDHQHYFSTEINPLKKVTHVRFNIFPDGGVSRIRLWGSIA